MRLLYYIREEKNGGWIYTLVIPDGLKLEAIKFAHELVGHLGQLKTIKKAEEHFYWASLTPDVSLLRPVQFLKELKE